MTTARRRVLHACYRIILAIDIEGSSRYPDPIKAYLRRSMYDLLEQALRAAGLTAQHHDRFVDRGDGVLTLIHPVDEAPKTVFLDTVVPVLSALLSEHNARHPTTRQFRLRAVVHAGEVGYDDNGCFGEALDTAFRLLNARDVKRKLSRTHAPMVLVVSDDIYECVVRHGYDGIDPKSFTRRRMPLAPCLVRPGRVKAVKASSTSTARARTPDLGPASDRA